MNVDCHCRTVDVISIRPSYVAAPFSNFFENDTNETIVATKVPTAFVNLKGAHHAPYLVTTTTTK